MTRAVRWPPAAVPGLLPRLVSALGGAAPRRGAARPLSRGPRPGTITVMRDITSYAALEAACDGDTLCSWMAQGLDGRSRAWRSADGRAVAVAAPALATRDRLAVWGAPDAAVPLVGAVLAETGPTYRPLGDGPLIDALVDGLPALARAGRFGWMDCTGPGPAAPARGPAGWLAEADLPVVAALLEASYPASYAKPGAPGVERWAGARDDDGQLAAVGALAWSAPAVGFISGVAVRPAARGQGLGRQVCTWLLAGALRRHRAAALMVDDANRAARRLYLGLGLRYRQLSVAAVAECPGFAAAATRPGAAEQTTAS